MQKKAFWLTCTLAWLVLTVPTLFSQAQVRVVVNRDFVNLRLFPALGSTVVGSANAGTVFVADARSGDSEWLRIRLGNREAWIGVAVITILEGNIEALPVRDPRSIPFGGNEAPRAGFTEATSDISGRLSQSGVRIRSGPDIAYRVLANAPRFSVFPLLGRTVDNQWVQVNFEGVLGWTRAEFVTILDDRSINELPVNGVIASDLPLESTDQNDLFGTLRFMRERIDLAQPSLDRQRQVWTDAAFGIVPPCGGYPARPSNFNIPNDLRARYAGTLEPLIRDFDTAMGNVRATIDLQIDVCQETGSELVLISTPVVTGGLNFVDDADVLFASLRRRIDELLPEIGPDDCVFEFAGRVDVLPLFPPQAIIEGTFNDEDRVLGFCFDASPLNIGYLEVLQGPTNYRLVVAVSPLENPTDFLASASEESSPVGTSTILSPIEFPFEGRYLLLLNAQTDGDEPPEGRFALVFVDIALGTPNAPLLSFDEDGNLVRNIVPLTLADGTVVGAQVADEAGAGATVTSTQAGPINVFADPNAESGIVGQLLPGQSAPALGTVTGWVRVDLGGGVSGWVQEEFVQFNDAQIATDGGQVECPGVFLTCNNLISCAEVQACVDAGNTLLDPNGNGIACDSAEGSPPLGCNVAAPLPN